MTTINLEKAMEIYKELEESTEMTTKREGMKMTIKECKENGWEYTFFFYKGVLAKIEAFNHRELIENLVK